MARITLIAFLLFTLCVLMAQEIAPWQYVRHSAVDNNNQVHVRFTGSSTILNEYEMFDWQNNAWQTSTLTNDVPLVYEALLPYTSGGSLKYRLRTSYDLMNQQVVALNPAYLTNETWPPALASLAKIADDPVGDTVMVNFPNLDITGTWCGYSANKIYAAMSNAANSFNPFNSFTSYNMYFAGLANTTTAIADSSIYAMLYTFSIPGVFTSGLFKFGLNFADTTVVFNRLGDIQAQVVNGKLMMSCNISDLTADASFGSWPPLYNSLGFITGTARIDISSGTPAFGIGDYSALTQLIFEQYNYQVTQNALPVVSNVSMNSIGNFQTLEFTYTDANQDFPLIAKVILDNDGEVDITPTIPDYTQPVTMTAILPMEGWNNAEIRLSDNNVDFVTYAIINTSNEDEIMPSAVVCNAYPNPFNPTNGNLNVMLKGFNNAPVKASVYNLKGQCVKRFSAQLNKTNSSLCWDGSTDDNSKVANGIYFLQLEQDTHFISKKIIVIR